MRGIANPKYYCQECGWAAKGPCPRHPGMNVMMGTKWRPGKKGKKTRLWDNRVHGSQTPGEPGKLPPFTPRGYHSRPFRALTSPSPFLKELGAKDFSHDGKRSW